MTSHSIAKHSKEKGNATYLVLGVIALVVIIVIGVVVATRNNKSDNSSNTGSNSSQQPASLLESKRFSTRSGSDSDKQSSRHEVSFQYPKGWKQASADAGSDVTFEDPQGDSIEGKTYKARVSYASYPTEKSLDAYAQNIIDEGKDPSIGVNLKSEEKITVDGQRAYLLQYTSKDPGTGTPLTIAQVIIVKDGTAHIMTGFAGTPAWDEHKAAIEASLKSLMIAS